MSDELVRTGPLAGQPLKQLLGGPEPDRPVPRSPVLGVSLSAYATAAAELSAHPAARAETLARLGLDEIDWSHVESTWLLRLATALMQGDMTLRDIHERAFAEAQRAAWEGVEPQLSLAQIAPLIALQETGADAGTLLARCGLTLSEWLRERSLWAARVAADPALGETLRRQVAEFKQAPPSDMHGPAATTRSRDTEPPPFETPLSPEQPSALTETVDL